MRLYLSGPITDNAFAYELFHAAEVTYSEMGHDIINPLKLDQGEAWHVIMRKDIAQLINCDGIVMLRGWTQSKGAILEHNIAKALKMSIIYDQSEIDIDTSYDRIYSSIEEICGVTKDQLRSNSRYRQYVDARRIFVLLMRDNKLTVKAIGRLLKRNHSTVTYLYKSSKNLFDVDTKFVDLFTSVKNRLNGCVIQQPEKIYPKES